MIQPSYVEQILFLDIETVSQHADFDEMDKRGQKLWIKKARKLTRLKDLNKDDCSDLYSTRAAIYAEFGKIISISVGYIKKNHDHYNLRIKSFYGSEKNILQDFREMLDKYFSNINSDFLCGHNIKEFDVPFICRRMIVHGIKLPRLLDLSDMKPWQLQHVLDTLTMWRFGDYKNYTSLDMLAYTLDVPSPKDGIDGSQVGKVFYIENNLDKIIDYCERDVVTVVQIMMRYFQLPMIENISFAERVNSDEEE